MAERIHPPVFDFEFMFQRIAETGVEVKKIFQSHRNKKLGFIPHKINPLDRLLEKNIITKSQCAAAKKYQIDWEYSNLTNHARMSFESILTDGGKKEGNILESEKRQIASENVRLIHANFKDVNNFTRKVIQFLFLYQMEIKNVVKEMGIKSKKKTYIKAVEQEAVMVCEFLEKFYKN